MAPRQSTKAADKDTAEANGTENAENAENVENVEANSTENTEGAETPATGKRPMPVYGLGEALDELPTGSAPRTRDKMFLDLLTPIVKDEDKWGKWFAVATYKTPTGAREAQKAIEKGERELPEGTWEHAVRKIEPTEPSNHKQFSVLYFRYMGADES